MIFKVAAITVLVLVTAVALAWAESPTVLLATSEDGLLVPVYCVDGTATLRTGDACLELVDLTAPVGDRLREAHLMAAEQQYCPLGGTLSGFRTDPPMPPYSLAVWPADRAAAILEDSDELEETPRSHHPSATNDLFCTPPGSCEVSSVLQFQADLDADAVVDQIYLTSFGYGTAIYWTSGLPGMSPVLTGGNHDLAFEYPEVHPLSLDLDGNGAREVVVEQLLEGMTDDYLVWTYHYRRTVWQGGAVTEPILVNCSHASTMPPVPGPDVPLPAPVTHIDNFSSLPDQLSAVLQDALDDSDSGSPIWQDVGLTVPPEPSDYEPWAYDGVDQPAPPPSSMGSLRHGDPSHAPPPSARVSLTILDDFAPEVGDVRDALLLARDELAACYPVAAPAELPTAVLVLSLDGAGSLLGMSVERPSMDATQTDCIERVVRSAVDFPALSVEHHTYRFIVSYYPPE